MATTKITKATVAAAVPREGRYAIYDSVVPGFGLRVFPTGHKTWVFDYRPGEGGRSVDSKRVTIGVAAYADASKSPDFTPDVARGIAQKLKAAVVMGGDPQGEISRQRAADTVEQLSEKFLSQHVEKKRGAATLSSYSDLLNRFVVKKHGKVKAKELSGRQISALHQAMSDTPYLANRMLSVVASMYVWAGGSVALVPEGMNPAKGIERFEEEARGKKLSGDELERLGAAIALAETDGIPWEINPEGKTKHVAKQRQATIIGEHAAAALRLLIFTGARVSEILNLRWDQIDFEQGIIVLPKHKTSRKRGAKAIVLNAPALAVLNGITRLGAYVVAGESAGTKDEKPRADLKRPWQAVRKAAALDSLRLHDLRHNFASFGAGGGLGLPIIGKMLGHSQPATTARYAHFDNDPVRKASNAIGADLAAKMSGVKSANVLVLPRGKRAS